MSTATTATIVCVGAYVAVVFIGMAIGMGVALKGATVDPTVKKERTAAAITGGVLGAVAAVAYGVMQQHLLREPSYWAVLSILLFGIWYAVYMVWPKSLPATPSPKTQQMQTASAAAHGTALGVALLLFFYYLWKNPYYN